MREIRVPKMGMSTVEVDVTRIMVGVGDRVEAGQELVEVEGDKATAVIETEWDGTVVDVPAHEGATMKVGDVVCRIEVDPQ